MYDFAEAVEFDEGLAADWHATLKPLEAPLKDSEVDIAALAERGMAGGLRRHLCCSSGSLEIQGKW
jgi:hypothetical protein